MSSSSKDIKTNLILTTAFASNTALLLIANDAPPEVVIAGTFATTVLPWIVGSGRIKDAPTPEKI